MRATKISSIIWFFLNCMSNLSAQKGLSAYVDAKGILRWASDKHEVNEFGVNYTLPFAYAYWAHKQLNIPHEQAIDEDVYHLTRLGLTAYRIHVWDTEISDSVGNLLNNDHVRLLDYTLYKMRARGFKIILTPIAFWNGIAETGKMLPGFSYKYGKNNSYSDSGAIKAAEKYLYAFVNHVNQYTGIAYKNDPDIIAFEISNEPEHPTETAQQTTTYIDRLVKAIRNTGCKKPLFYCVSIAPRLLNAFLAADIQGASVQWYSLGILSGQNLQGNFLTNIDKWPKDSITAPVRAAKKALIAYEFDAADNGYTYTYPVMAREMRKQSIQFATMFTYDPLHLAYANTEYQTHYMNLAYAPQKALSLKIAGEVFHHIPLDKGYGNFPSDTLFDVARVSYTDNLAEFRTEEKFMYANNTTSQPVAINKLKEIAGYGSSPVIQYNGRGAYFLDKLEEGIWRMEVMPDATWVSDPFAVANLSKEVSAIVWNDWPMTILLPDLQSDYNVIGLNKGNDLRQTAVNSQVIISPGTYLLVNKKKNNNWKPDDRWKTITLNEFVAPPTNNTYLLHRPPEEITAGSSLKIDVEVVAAQKPQRVQLFITSSEAKQLAPVNLQQTAPYAYSITVPDSLIQREGILKYQISVHSKGQVTSYPGSISGTPSSRDFYKNEMYTTRIVKSQAPVCLLDVADNYAAMRKPHRRFNFVFRPSVLPGKTGLVMEPGNINYTSFFFRDRVAGRKADLAAKQQVVLRGYALNEVPVKLWVVLQLKDGSEWGGTILLNNSQLSYQLSLKSLKRIMVTGPGEKGAVSITPYPYEIDSNAGLNINEAETIKLTVAQGTTISTSPGAVVEYITLE